MKNTDKSIKRHIKRDVSAFTRIVSLIILISFLWSNFVWAYPESNNKCLAKGSQIENITDEWKIISCILAIYDLYGFKNGRIMSDEIDSTERVKEYLRDRLRENNQLAQYRKIVDKIKRIFLGRDKLIYVGFEGREGKEILLRLAQPGASMDSGIQVLKEGEEDINGFRLQVVSEKVAGSKTEDQENNLKTGNPYGKLKNIITGTLIISAACTIMPALLEIVLFSAPLYIIFIAIYAFAMCLFPIYTLIVSFFKIVKHNEFKKGNPINILSYANTPILQHEDLPTVTIMVPVYKESFNDTIRKTLEYAIAAVNSYKAQGKGKANLVVCDDGLMVFSDNNLGEFERIARNRPPGKRTVEENEVLSRLDFYRENGISFVARPKSVKGRPETIRRGTFKKASNLNYTLELDQWIRRLSGVPGISYSDILARIKRMPQYKDGCIEGEIHIGDLMLFIDKDSITPEDIIISTVGEFNRDPMLAYTTHRTRPVNSDENYFTRLIGRFTDLLYNLAIPDKVKMGAAVPFVGHNAFVRKNVLEKCGFWDVNRATEDLTFAIKAAGMGYHGKYLSYKDMDFGEAVTMTYLEEAGKYTRYCFGGMEIVFNPLKKWLKNGLFTRQWIDYIKSDKIQWFQKIDLIIYLLSSLNIAFIIPISILGFFMPSGIIPQLLTVIMVFYITATCSDSLMKYGNKEIACRSESSLFKQLLSDFKYAFPTGIIFIGYSLHIIKGIILYLFGLKPDFGSTNVDKIDDSWKKLLRGMKGSNRIAVILSAVYLSLIVYKISIGAMGIATFLATSGILVNIISPYVFNPYLLKGITADSAKFKIKIIKDSLKMAVIIPLVVSVLILNIIFYNFVTFLNKTIGYLGAIDVFHHENEIVRLDIDRERDLESDNGFTPEEFFEAETAERSDSAPVEDNTDGLSIPDGWGNLQIRPYTEDAGTLRVGNYSLTEDDFIRFFPLEMRVGMAWDELNEGDYESAYWHAQDIISDYGSDAHRGQERKLEMEGGLIEYDGNDGDDDDSKAIFSYGSLNDVAAAHFIAWRTSIELGLNEEAEWHAEELMFNLYLAQVWDPQGWFWTPADAVSEEEKEGDSDSEMDSRGWEGLANEKYTPAIRDALGVDSEGNIIPEAERNFVCVRYVPEISEFKIVKFRYDDSGEEIFGGISVPEGGIETLNKVIGELEDIEKGFIKDAQIVFMHNQSGHYGISRDQYYLDIDLLQDSELLKVKLHHEIQERMAILTHPNYDEWRKHRGNPETEKIIRKEIKKIHELLLKEEGDARKREERESEKRYEGLDDSSQSAIVVSKKEGRRCIKNILKSGDPDSIHTYKEQEFSWDDKCDYRGRVSFTWTNKDRTYVVRLSTGVQRKENVRIRLNWDTELGYYVFTTERVVDGKSKIATSKFYWNEKKGHWDIQSFNRNTCRIVDMLKSNGPNNIETYKEKGVIWDDKCDSHGRVYFIWTDNNGSHVVSLHNGTRGKGNVQIRLNWDTELGYYVFTTERVVDGKRIIATSRFFWNEKKRGWDIESFNRDRYRIVDMLKSSNPNNIDAYKEKGIIWDDKCGITGTVLFRWTDKNSQHRVYLSTGNSQKDNVRIRLNWDSELGYYVFTTERVVDGKRIIATSRFFWNEKKGHWDIQSFNRNTCRIVDMLKSNDPNNIDTYKEKGLIWDDECASDGRVLFAWTDKDGGHAVPLSTGVYKKGNVRIRLNWDIELGYYVFTTERFVGGKKIVRYARFEKDKKGNWKIKQINTYEMYKDKKSVEEAFKRRREKGLENSLWALLYGKKPDRYLYDAARRFNVPLEELTVLDREYNRESEIASIIPAGKKPFVTRTRKETERIMQVLIEGKEQELNDRSKFGNKVVIRGQISILRKIVKGNIKRPLKELLGLNMPNSVNQTQLAGHIDFFNDGVGDDPYQSSMVRLGLSSETNVLLIQGGPGSGKSTALAELIFQYIKQGKRILLTAHDNSALDNMLEKLDAMHLPILRAVNARDIDTAVKEGRISSRIKHFCIKSCRRNIFCPHFSERGRKIFQERSEKYRGGMVLGVTVDTGAINQAVRNFNADIVAIDEAGLCDAVDTLVMAYKAREKIILAGDHKQLPPYFREDEYREYNEEYKKLLRESFLAYSWDRGYSQVFLARNYRSHPLIAHIVGRLFYERLVVPKTWTFMERDTVRIVDVPMEEDRANEQAIYGLEGGQRFQQKTDYQNVKEAKACVLEYERAIKSGYPASEITIITGYAGQVELIRNLLREYFNGKRIVDDINRYLEDHVITINQSQGRENSVIILSFVRSNPEPHKVGFMGSLLRLNVALSRAKDRLVLVGDIKTLFNAGLTEEDRLFSERFSQIKQIIGEYDALAKQQEEIGGFTIHESIQEMNGLIDLGILKEKAGVTIDLDVLRLISDILLGMDTFAYNEFYPLLEELHESAMFCLSRREDSVFRIREEFYEDFIKRVKAIAHKYKDIIKVDGEDNILLLWLKDNNRKPVVVQLVKEVGVDEKQEEEPISREEIMGYLQICYGDIFTRMPELASELLELLLVLCSGGDIKSLKENYLQIVSDYERGDELVNKTRRLLDELGLGDSILNTLIGMIYRELKKNEKVTYYLGSSKRQNGEGLSDKKYRRTIRGSLGSVSKEDDRLGEAEEQKRIKPAFDRLEKTMNDLARENTEINSIWSRVSGLAQNLRQVQRLQFVVPVSVLQKSPDITIALKKMGVFAKRNDGRKFELIIYDVENETQEELLKNTLREAKGAQEGISIFCITKDQMASSNNGAYPSRIIDKIRIVKRIAGELYPLKEKEYMAIVTDETEQSEAEMLISGLEQVLPENISVRIPAESSEGGFILLSDILCDWMGDIMTGRYSSVKIILPKLILPAEFKERLEAEMENVWGILSAA